MSLVHIFGGGTFSPVRNHLALAAMAFGETATRLRQLVDFSQLELTKMALPSSEMVTNEDVWKRLDVILDDQQTKCIIMNVALCDYTGSIGDVVSGSHATRLGTSSGPLDLRLVPAPKLISRIKATRPDILLVGFKTTTGQTPEKQIELAKRMNVDIVLANDTVTRKNLIVASGFVVKCNTREKILQSLAYIVNKELKTDKHIKSVYRSPKYDSYEVEVPVGTLNPKTYARGIVAIEKDFDGISEVGWSMATQNIMDVVVRLK